MSHDSYLFLTKNWEALGHFKYTLMALGSIIYCMAPKFRRRKFFFRNFRTYAVITKILFTKFLSQLIILDTIGTG